MQQQFDISSEVVEDQSINHEDNKYNVVVLVHGIDGPGTKNDMVYFEEEIHKLKKFHLIIRSKINTGKTGNGIDEGGLRLAEEITEDLERLSKTGTFFLSIIGHSLGGLYGRACVKHLRENQQLWKRIVPVSYISMSSPHLGVRRPKGIFNSLVDVTARVWFRNRTLKELVLEDGDIHATDYTIKPLLLRMAEKDGEYYQALAEFKHRTLFAIVKGDVQVPYCSAAITSHNPYPRTEKPESARIRGYSGFDSLSEELKEYFNTEQLTDYNPFHAIAHLVNNNDQNSSDNSKEITPQEYLNDHYTELEYHPSMIRHLNTLRWRRIDLEFNSMFCHDFMIRKCTIPGMGSIWHPPGEFAVQKVIQLLVHDHNKSE